MPAPTSKYSRTNLFCALSILFGMSGALHGQQTTGQQTTGQQTTEKLLQCNDPAQITDPVLITAVTVGDKAVDCGLFVKPGVVQSVAPFQASGDWLQHLTISLINRTEKTISSVTVTMMFLDNAADCRTQVCPMEQMHLGQLPTADAYDARTGRPLATEHPATPPLAWTPGQTVTVRISDFISEMETKLSNDEPLTAVSKVAIHVGPVFFEDGMRWAAGGYSVPLSVTPGKFKYLPHEYFPGRRGSNWPPGYNN